MLGYAISLKYMYAGYAVIFAVMVVYIISLFLRWRNLKRDLQSLEETGKKE